MDLDNKNRLEMVSIRLVKNEALMSEVPIKRPEDAVKVLSEYLCDMDREVLCIINLKKNGQPINCNIVSIGALDQTLASPREILKSSILSNAAEVILVHNHPSGSLQPSGEDIAVTDRMLRAYGLIGIPLLDHVITGRKPGQFYSFYENNILPKTDIRFAQDIESLEFKAVNERGSGILYGHKTGEELEKNGGGREKDMYIESRNDEKLLLHGEKDFYGIYQIDQTGNGIDYLFMDMDYTQKHGINITRKDYNLVYMDELKGGDTLDSLFVKFNLSHPEDFTGHSMSTSDVVVFHQGVRNTIYYVDSIGFKELPDFFGDMPVQEEKRHQFHQKDRKYRPSPRM